MRILRAIVEPTTGLLAVGVADLGIVTLACHAEAKSRRVGNCQAAATAFRQVVIATTRSARWVRAETR